MSALAPVTRTVLSQQAQAAQGVADLLAAPEMRGQMPVLETITHWIYGTVMHVGGSDDQIVGQVKYWAALYNAKFEVVHAQVVLGSGGSLIVSPGWAVVHLPQLQVTIGGVLREVRR